MGALFFWEALALMLMQMYYFIFNYQIMAQKKGADFTANTLHTLKKYETTTY